MYYKAKKGITYFGIVATRLLAILLVLLLLTLERKSELSLLCCVLV